ncbi:MAG TPA: CNP1-like family protein [Ramlibacter sp.]|nr:CNP1-like family protein [Ramlibacter sp.]
MRLRLCAWLAAVACAAHAQTAPVDPDWREAEAPPPPAVRLDGLIPLEMPRSALRFGVDPASVSLGSDRIVRYVVVAVSATGAVNALYEGLRCDTAEFKVYARASAASGWALAKDPPWRTLRDGQQSSSHTMLIARSGACFGRAPNRSAVEIVRDLRAQANARFNLPQ